MQLRHDLVNKAAAKLMLEGKLIFSPISHTHPIAVAGELPREWQFWESYDRAYLAVCKELLVFCLAGWKESTGVQAEIAIAKELQLPVTYITREYIL